MSTKKLGILILSKPGTADIESAEGVAKAALSQGIEVKIFLMGDGVLHIDDPRLKDLVHEGAKITFCIQNAHERNLALRPEPENPLVAGTQYDLACIVEDSDRFISFT